MKIITGCNKLLFPLCVAVFSGCAYRIQARLPLQYPRLFIEQFENRTSEPFLGYHFTQYVSKEMVRRTSVSLAHDARSAPSLGGEITQIGRDVISKDSTGQVISERLTVYVSVHVKPVSGKSRTFTLIGARVYTRTGSIVRRKMIMEACQDAADQIIHRLIQREVTADV